MTATNFQAYQLKDTEGIWSYIDATATRCAPPQGTYIPTVIHPAAPLHLTQILARNPLTGTVTRISNSKVVHTAGSQAVGANLVPIPMCVDFLKGSCPAGSNCPSLHVLGMSSRGWPLISVDEAPVDGVSTYEAGWTLPCYDPTLSLLAEVPSQLVARTQGSAAYIVQYNEHGPSGRFRYRVCREYSTTGQCANGGDCPMIHTRSDLETHKHSKVHVNFVLDDVTASRYPTMQPGRMIRVSDPNIRTMVHEVPSEYVLRNQGSAAYERDPTNGRRPMHCAHFYLKKMCNRGPDCTFFHVLTVDPAASAFGLPHDLGIPEDYYEHNNSVQQEDTSNGGPWGMEENVAEADSASSGCNTVLTDGHDASTNGSAQEEHHEVEDADSHRDNHDEVVGCGCGCGRASGEAESKHCFRHDPYSFSNVRIAVKCNFC